MVLARNVDRAGWKRGGDGVLAENDLFDRMVVSDHGHDGFRFATGAARRVAMRTPSATKASAYPGCG